MQLPNSSSVCARHSHTDSHGAQVVVVVGSTVVVVVGPSPHGVNAVSHASAGSFAGRGQGQSAAQSSLVLSQPSDAFASQRQPPSHGPAVVLVVVVVEVHVSEHGRGGSSGQGLQRDPGSHGIGGRVQGTRANPQSSPPPTLGGLAVQPGVQFH